jgi:lysine/ornithine N-monooxygenase
MATTASPIFNIVRDINSSDIAVIGAGPYGLSIAAHLRARDIEHRIVGDPMQFWLGHMPKGMLLKSDGFASTLYDPKGHFTLRRYCEERNIEYADLGTPVRLEDFCAYGLAFQQRFAPNLDNKRVTSLERTRTGFTLHLGDGESFTAQRVVIATGLSYFEHVPSQLAGLPKDLLSHSSAHVHLHRFKGRDVTVIGGGASATELATLLHEAGCDVRLVARRPSIELHSRMELSRTLAHAIRRPISPVGPGWKSRFFTDLPLIFHNLPKSAQNRLVKGFLGPAGGWFLRGRLEQFPLLAGYQIQGAEACGDRALLWLRSWNGDVRRIETDHVIAATGYRADIRRLPFLSTGIASQLKLFNNAPELSSHFESSIPGLFFVGPAAVDSFGPLVRFACGAKFTAGRLSNHLARTSRLTKRRTAAAAPQCAHSARP